MKQRLVSAQKGKLSSTLKNWLPLLQAGLNDLGERLSENLANNPFCEVRQNFDEELKEEKERKFSEDEHYQSYEKIGKKEFREELALKHASLFEDISEQIDAPLFPTTRSQKIAMKIAEHLDEGGFFDEDYEGIEQEIGVTKDEIERIRGRFIYLNPPGIGAVDFVESYLFQLHDAGLSDAVYELAVTVVKNMDAYPEFAKNPSFKEAMNAIKKLKNPPAIEYLEESNQVIPDIFVFDDGEKLEVKINDAYYPEIIIEAMDNLEKDEFVRPKLKEARDLVDALNMRKATLLKLGLMIVEFQYDYFKGGAIRPMKLQNIADELGLNVSTISRAIANKYLSSNRGIWPIKSFFSTAISEDTSAAAIKEYLKALFSTESRKKPLSDEAALKFVEEKFTVKLERRTITKYRMALGVASSSERKKLYQMSL
jgi:RNA polymerase sigma-54 factor